MRHVGDRSDCGVDDADGDRAAAVAWLARDPLALGCRAGGTIRDAADTFPFVRALGRHQGCDSGHAANAAERRRKGRPGPVAVLAAVHRGRLNSPALWS